MKTASKLTIAVALAIAAAAPAFAKDTKSARHVNAMSQIQQNEGTRAQAFVPQTEPANDPAAFASQY